MGTAAVTGFSRHPQLMATFAATMQATFGPRFVLGIGRGSVDFSEALHLFGSKFDAFADYVTIVKRLLRNETVDYHGPAGDYDGIRFLDSLDGPPPEVISCTLRGPKAIEVAARVADGIMLPPCLTPEACATAVTQFRGHRERLGLNPDVRVVQSVVTACNIDEAKTANLTKARFLTYTIGFKAYAKNFLRLNGWDGAVMARIQEHELFNSTVQNADEGFYRHDLLDAARLVPDEWMQQSCAIGTAEECAKQWQRFRDAGADQVMIYGCTPREAADVIDVWSRQSSSRV